MSHEPAHTPALAVTAEDIAKATECGTEYDEKRYELARLIGEIVAPNTAWHYAPDSHQDACYADAHTALLALPHLLSDDERERLAPLLPALALPPEVIATGERGTVQGSDPESLLCVCGNHAADEGLLPATPAGITVHFHNTPKPEALAVWPEDESELHTLCRVCGRLYGDETIRATNTAPVVLRVDLADGTPAGRAVIAHDAEMGTP